MGQFTTTSNVLKYPHDQTLATVVTNNGTVVKTKNDTLALPFRFFSVVQRPIAISGTVDNKGIITAKLI